MTDSTPPHTVTLDREKYEPSCTRERKNLLKKEGIKEMRKLRKNEGFTLAELLIVVAIIAVLVAVSIPIFTSQLEKSRENTDIANFRAAKAAAVTKVLDGKVDGTLTYDAQAGILTDSFSGTGYGKGTTVPGNKGDAPAGYKYDQDYDKDVVEVTFDEKGALIYWSKYKASDAVRIGEGS